MLSLHLALGLCPRLLAVEPSVRVGERVVWRLTLTEFCCFASAHQAVSIMHSPTAIVAALQARSVIFFMALHRCLIGYLIQSMHIVK